MSIAAPTKLWLALSVLLLLAGCGQNSVIEGEMVFYRGNGAEPETLDPNIAIAKYEDNIISDMLVGLMTQDVNGDPIPGVAESWETSPDGLTWTFHLREHLWSDGTPVTANDFVYSWQRVLNPQIASRYAYFLYFLKNAQAVNTGAMAPSELGAQALDDHTLVLQLDYPAPYLLEMLTHNTTLPVPRHIVEAHGNAWTRPGNYVGNGAYSLAEWVPNDHITLTKNPLFFDAAHVMVDRVTFYPSQDYDAALRRFRAGELDIQSRLPATSIDWLRQNMPEVLSIGPQLTVEFIAVNQARPPFDDARVRKALNLALNREMITDTVRRIGESPAYNLVPPQIANYPGGVAFDFKNLPYAERLATAQDLMRQAGYGPNRRLSTALAVRATSADARRVPAAIQQMWREIFVDLEIAQMDTAIFYSRAEQHEFDLAMAAWGADFNDASNFLDLLRTGNGNNYGQYSNPEFDALLDRAKFETDVKRRGQLLAQAESLALADCAWIPELFWVTTNLVHTYVKGWVTNPTDTNRTRWVSIDEEARAAAFP